MERVCIGIHVHAEPRRFAPTLHSVRDTAPEAELLILPDGPEPELEPLLSGLPCSATGEARGAPACFNRLAAASDASVLVLLESGSIVGPGWLEALLSALAADPRNGLAGPSTNLAWNQQCVFPHSSGGTGEILRCCRQARLRFGDRWRTLEPLHSLADFCYAVTRETIQAAGAADERYGLGPCWEMDYNIRAARAGFRGVWAGAAYVYRAPFTARRRRQERRLFEASKRLYQDKFCALRLQRRQSGYEDHCRGDACEHFAPPELIQIHLPPTASAEPGGGSPGAVLPSPSPSPSPPPRVVPSPPSVPLITCIMPTRDRPDFVLQAVDYFLRQDYPRRELIIVDDKTPGLRERLPDDSSIRYLSLPPGQTIGAKRNRAVRESRGEIIAHWDDDDWYGPRRLSRQAEPLLAGSADVSALNGTLFFDLPRWEFWGCTPQLHSRLFAHDAHGGTLMYRRGLWRETLGYPNCSLAEDACFLRRLVSRGARLALLPAEGLFVYLRHGTNSWAFTSGKHVDPDGWRRLSEPDFPPGDRMFYLERSARRAAARSRPLASCIMPTAGRRRFVPQAILYFLRQNYPDTELLVVDDGPQPVEDLLPSDPRIRYLRLDRNTILGEKRNLACAQARGEFVLHWDDDDWQSPWRVDCQVKALLETKAEVCGLNQVYFYEPAAEREWRYSHPDPRAPWVYGGTLCYRRSFWRNHPFPGLTVGEDNAFVAAARGKIAALERKDFYVGLIHNANTSPKRTSGSCWRRLSGSVLRDLLGRDRQFYQGLKTHHPTESASAMKQPWL